MTGPTSTIISSFGSSCPLALCSPPWCSLVSTSFSGHISPGVSELADAGALTPTGIVAASKVYRKLKKLAPQSEETIQARELIKAAVRATDDQLD